MSEAKVEAYLATGVAVLITLMIYNLFLKTFLPTTVRNWVGLG